MLYSSSSAIVAVGCKREKKKQQLRALHLNLWKPLSPCQREIGSVDNPNIFNFALSDTEEMCQQWGPTASKHRSLTSNNLDSTPPPVASHRRSATFISFRSRSVDQKWRLNPPQHARRTQNNSGVFTDRLSHREGSSLCEAGSVHAVEVPFVNLRCFLSSSRTAPSYMRIDALNYIFFTFFGCRLFVLVMQLVQMVLA